MNKASHALLSWLVIWLAIFTITASSFAHLQAQPTTPTADQCEAKILELESDTLLDDPIRAASIGFYRGAIEQLTKANGFASQSAEYRRLSSEAPQLLSSIRSELGLPPVEPTTIIPDGAALPQLEQALAQATAGLQAKRQSLADLQTESTRRNEQSASLTARLVKVRQELSNLVNPSEAGVQTDISPILADAQETIYQTTVLVYQAEIDSIETELESYDARRELLPARRDRAQRRVTEAEKLVTAWQVVVADYRKLSAEQAAQEAIKLRKEAARQHPILKEFAERTVDIARERVKSQSYSGGTESTRLRLTQARSELATLSSEYAAIQSRLARSGLNRATGLLLRHQYEALPDIPSLRREVRTTLEAIEDQDYTLIELQEERVAFGDIDRVAQSLLSQIPPDELETNQSELLPVAHELASARRDLLDQLVGDASSRFESLVELNTTLRESVTIAQAYKDFIEERILWVRSIAGDRAPRLTDLQSKADWLFDFSSWNRAIAQTTLFVQSKWVDVIGVVGLLALFLLLSFRCRYWLRILSERVARYTTDSFRYTLVALILTAMISAPVAGTLIVLGWLLKAPENQELVAIAMGDGLQSAAIFLYPLVFLRHMLRPKGLAISHFRWSKEAAQPMKRSLSWFTPTVVPIVFLVAVIDSGGDEAANASLGRILFSLELIALTIFLQRVLRPTGPVLRRFIETNTGGWMIRLLFIWYPLAVVLPLVFAVLSWLGYHYTALQLQMRLERSLILVLILVIINEVLHRWLYIARRRVAVEDAKRRRAQAEAEAKANPELRASPAPMPTSLDEEKIDLPALSVQTRQIFKTTITVSAVIGLYIIWAQALPALRMLDRIQVWPSIQAIEPSTSLGGAGLSTPYAVPTQPQGESVSATQLPMPGNGLTPSENSASESMNPEIVSITIADIGLSLIIFLATWVAFRNVPGLIEIVVLQRLPLDAGSRYALSTVLRYLIAIVGIIIAFQTVGISWSNVQWLAAALTFGLAFGLQEIFANFVSGLIILAERPIRLGDTVTVGGVTGTVMRIRMRATTIGDWDRKELVIPNKAFITGEVINWTLTDSVLRVKINVGVSYSSDIDQVESILLKVAKKEPAVLVDPAPQVLFKKFGDSSLEFELRVFIPNIEYFIVVQNDIHNAIYKSFKKAGIEIAFPQRDLHVRSIGDLGKLIDREVDSKPE